MGRAFKIKPYNNNHKKKQKQKQNKIIEKKIEIPIQSPYVKDKPKIVRPVYFDFMYCDEPPKVTFDVKPCEFWD